MAFLKRLGFYLFGLSVGLIFLSMFLKKKSEETGVSFCYFPNCRTLKDIRSKPMYYSEDVSKQLKNKEIDSLDIVYLLNEGDVDFSKSDTKSVPCKTYIIEGPIKEKEVQLVVKNCNDKATVESVNPIQ